MFFATGADKKIAGDHEVRVEEDMDTAPTASAVHTTVQAQITAMVQSQAHARICHPDAKYR